MTCQRCNSTRVMNISCKCTDMFWANMEGWVESYDGYCPTDIGVGDNGYGDYVDFEYCLNCGQIQGSWPRAISEIEEEKLEEIAEGQHEEEEEDEDVDYDDRDSFPMSLEYDDDKFEYMEHDDLT